ncbi:MAG: amidohydrolase [Rhizobiales bacterium]|nr:amidohydrolase [Hyphomicrobiales bacterium]
MLLADMVALNGRIHTLDADARVVSGIAAHRGRIVALGERDAFENAIGPSTRIVDLEGRTVVPGIVDSHCHPDTFAIRMAKWRDLGPDVIQSKAQLLATIAGDTRKAASDSWFVGYRFNELKSGGYPTLAELDAASHGRPVFILRTDAHLGLANSAAFAACGIGRDTPDPAFGRYDRVPESSELTGLVRETAAHVFLDRIHATDTEDDIARGMECVFDQALKLGITSLYNSLTPSRAIRAYQAMKRAGRMRVRMGIIASGREPGLVEALIASGIRSGFGDDELRLIGVEWCPDCSTSGRTAAYYEPYIGKRILGEPPDNTGMLLYEADDLKRRAIAAHKAGLQVCIEGVGDRGIDFALDTIEAALEAHPVADHRMRVEHCCYATPTIRERLKRLGAVDSSATGFMYDLGDAYVANRGAAAMRHMWPHRSLIDSGIPAPGHSDAAVCRLDPWAAMWAMVNRKSGLGADLDAREAVTPREALEAYTRLGAWSGFEENVKGTLEVGKVADFIVLDRDLFTIDPDDIRNVTPLMTFVGGELRHQA